MKSTVEQIRARFDADVERFSNLETGQSATIDAPLVLETISEVAAASTPQAKRILDVGCGAGNNAIKLLQRLPGLEVTLLDLSAPMLERARTRVLAAGASAATILQQDIREAEFADGSFDIIVAAAVLHHLRTPDEWHGVFAKFFRILAPGGSIWISDLIEHTNPVVQATMWKRYGEYLAAFKGPEYREHVFAYIAMEDTPAPLMAQVDLLRSVGFVDVDILHKNSVFAAFGGRKA